MLTSEQKITLENACKLYANGREQLKTNTALALEMINDAFKLLTEYIDVVNDIYYKVVLANCINELQKYIHLDDTITQIKSRFYLELLDYFLDSNTSGFNTEYTGHLFNAFDALGKLFLCGKDGVPQIDQNAYVCYRCITLLGNPAMAQFCEAAYLSDFVENPATGQMIFTGIRE